MRVPRCTCARDAVHFFESVGKLRSSENAEQTSALILSCDHDELGSNTLVIGSLASRDIIDDEDRHSNEHQEQSF